MLRIFLALWLALTPAFAWAGSMTLMGAGKPAVGGGGTITWDPAKKAAAVTLTNGSLTASVASNTFYASVLGSGSGRSTGKYFFKLTLTTVNFDGQGVGIGNASAALSSPVGGNPDNNSIGWWPLAGAVRMGNILVTTIQTAAQGDVLEIAYDIGAQLIWFRSNNSTNWNNNVSNNPATGVGGISFAGMNAGPYFPMTTLEIGGDTFTGDFTTAGPSGFGNP